MIKLSIEDLTGDALNWAVGTAQGGIYDAKSNTWTWPTNPVTYSAKAPDYAAEPALVYPIISNEKMITGPCDPEGRRWFAEYADDHARAIGRTLLVAAMRCFVASKCREEFVEVPDEFVSPIIRQMQRISEKSRG